MALVAATRGVDSVALAGDARDQVVVVGDGVDSIRLATALRKKVGPAQIVQVATEAKKDGGDKKKAPAAPAPATAAPAVHQYVSSPWYYQYPPVSVVYEPPAAGYAHAYQAPPDSICSIM
ncbi:hypothetical protein BAE44_0019760 [Dichanthelium oligosanthes]|uniref:HMA domain-containing protein n=1 Tax=Dichanthelium oligosanthes TaxID=888268 RepID=A0A1E5V282_9POAL|nr:hypothetical protein BAE44_0019760 [Dichanthelium oligosanthes]